MAKRKKTNEDLPDENIENTGDADSFGLPDIDYKPIDRDENATQDEAPEESTSGSATQQSSYQEERPRERYVYTAPEEEKSKAPVVIAIVIAAVVVLAGFLIYNFVYKPKAEKERIELAKAAKAKADQEKARLAKEREEEERRQRDAAEAAANAKPAEGVIETITSPTKRYYVVITSAIDADLTMDYAKKLSAKGVSTKIIPPFGKWKFNRLSIGDYDTFALAQSSADAAKPEYGSGVWVIRY